jgi:hypothetical protein
MGDFNLDKTLELVLAPRTLWMVLSVGLAVLTVALLILMRTRWGQARPLSKCVVLSVFAHLLLVGYAHMTNLFYDGVPSASDGVIEIEVVAEHEAPRAREQQTEPEVELPPWEELGVDPPLLPPPVELARREPTVDVPGHQERVEPPTSKTQPPKSDLPLEQLRAKLPEAAVPSPKPTRHAHRVDAAPIEMPRVPRHTPSPADAEPDPPRLARLPTEITRPARARPDLPDAPARAAENMADRLQRLAQQPLEADPAEALAHIRDRTARATNKADASWQSVVPGRANSADTPPGSAEARPAAAANVITPITSNADPDGAVRYSAEPGSTVSIASRSPARGDDLATIYRFRLRDDRERLGRARGGTEDAEKAVQAALDWLAAVQRQDGRWDASAHGGGAQRTVQGEDRKGAGANADTGITALALLAFLAAGETHLKGKHRAHVQKGLEYLLRQQSHDGNLAGNASMFARMYCHGIATLALGEAYAMTRDDRIRPYLQRAVAYTVAAQQPTGGGWRYQPGDAGDMSQFGWQLMALKSAEAAGIAVNRRTQILMRRFLASCSAGNHGGLASYRQGERVTRTMTAEALVCRFFIQEDLQQPTIDEAADYLVAELPGFGKPNLYCWYYATLGLYQLQDERWQRWNRALQHQLISSQRNAGPLAGSWDPATVWGGCGGRVYSTAMAALCLEVYYRYLPLYEISQPSSPGGRSSH